MNATDDNVPRVSVERLRAFIADAFVAASLPKDDACVLGELIAEADSRGTDTHGVFRMPLYVRRIKAGGINPRPDIRIIEERPSTALLDGASEQQQGIGQPKGTGKECTLARRQRVDTRLGGVTHDQTLDN